MSHPNETRIDRTRRGGRGRVLAWTVGCALAAGSVLAAQAIADSRPVQHLRQLAADGGMPQATPAQLGPGDGIGHGPRSPFADMTDEEIDRMTARAVAHAAIEVDATDEQRDEITAIVLAVAGEVRAVPDGLRDAGARMRELLLAEEVDAEALEAVRAGRIAEADRVSREIVSAVTEIAGLLTPEQRRLAAERIEAFRAMRERRRGE